MIFRFYLAEINEIEKNHVFYRSLKNNLLFQIQCTCFGSFMITLFTYLFA